MNQFLRRILFLPPQASTVAREIDYLHYFVILTTMAGATVLTVVGVAFVIRYRARGGEVPREDPAARPPVWAEISVIVGLLGLFCLWWVIGFVEYLKVQVAPENALTVYVTGKQWMWKFAYPEGARGLSTLYVPTGRPVKLLLTSRDVIHSFYVPDFRIKQDAVPGRYTTTWFEVTQPGVHAVLCAEYCGTGHSTMHAQVIALAPEDYARWTAAAGRGGASQGTEGLTVEAGESIARSGDSPGPWDGETPSTAESAEAAPGDLVRVGMVAAGALGCLRCHSLDGSRYIGPTWAGLFGSHVPLANGATALANEAFLTESMMDPMARLHDGYQPVMPTYKGRMTPGQVAAILELIKSVRDVPARPPETSGGPTVGLAAPPQLAPGAAAPAGAMEPAPAPEPQAPPRTMATPGGALPPPDQQGLPPPGTSTWPEPRLPIRVGEGAAP